jgi:hypothetical protein
VGTTAVWVSDLGAFVVAGVGVRLLVSALVERRWRWVGLLFLTASAWLASFAVVYRISRTHLSSSRVMWGFWDFAFPHTIRDAALPLRQVFYLFANPLNFTTPLGTTLSALPPFAFFVVGCWSMGKRAPAQLRIVIGPALIALAASCAHAYPFHGRLVLFLVPALVILVAEGAERVGLAANRRWVWALILGAILVFPAVFAVSQLAGARDEREFHPHGDRHPPSLEPATFPF